MAVVLVLAVERVMWPFGNASKIARLVQNLRSDDAMEREDALLALIELDLRREPGAIAELERVVADELEIPALRVGAARALAGTGDAKTVLAAAEVLFAPDQDVELRWRSVCLIAKLAPAVPRALALVKRATQDRAPLVRLHAAYGLHDVDATFDPLPIIGKLVDDLDETVRIEAVKALTTLDAERVEPALRKALRDRSETVRTFAEMALAMNRSA
jgi:HEAT repeat protein